MHHQVLVFGMFTNFVHYVDTVEIYLHLLFFHDFTSNVWKEVFQWLILVIVIPLNLFLLFECLSGMTRGTKKKKGF